MNFEQGGQRSGTEILNSTIGSLIWSRRKVLMCVAEQTRALSAIGLIHIVRTGTNVGLVIVCDANQAGETS